MTDTTKQAAPSKVGTRFLLWRREWRHVATTSSRVGNGDGWVVLEEIPVTVIDQRTDVPGMFGRDKKYLGLKARADDGREFTRNWDSYPDDAMTGATLSWYHINAKEEAPGHGYVDAIQASSIFYRAIGGQYYDEEGNFKVPTGAQVCPRHGDTFLPGDTCDSCDFDESLKGGPGEVSYVDCPFCEMQRRAGDRDKDLRGLHIRWDHPEVYLRWTAIGHDPSDWSNLPS